LPKWLFQLFHLGFIGQSLVIAIIEGRHADPVSHFPQPSPNQSSWLACRYPITTSSSPLAPPTHRPRCPTASHPPTSSSPDSHSSTSTLSTWQTTNNTRSNPTNTPPNRLANRSRDTLKDHSTSPGLERTPNEDSLHVDSGHGLVIPISRANRRFGRCKGCSRYSARVEGCQSGTRKRCSCLIR